MLFCIVEYKADGTKEVLRDEDGSAKLYPTGAEAGAAAQSIAGLFETIRGERPRLAVKPYGDAEAAADAEAQAAKLSEARCLAERRLLFREWSRAPFEAQDWYRAAYEADGSALPDHFLHVSENDAAKLAFYPSQADLLRDRTVAISPAKYLLRYCGVDNDTAAHWASVMSGEASQVKFARTADDIEEVYVNGPSSCMAYEAGSYASPCHPARVYASPDLAVAYLTETPDSARIVARCLVAPDKKLYGRAYGDPDRMRHALSLLGYDAAGSEGFDGCRVLRIAHRKGYVMPYLDNGYYVQEGDDDKYLVMSSDCGEDAQSTNGLILTHDTRCEWCEDYCDEDDARDVQGSTVCESCYDSSAFYCEDCEESYHQDDAHSICDGDRYVCGRCLRNRYTRCDDCREYYAETTEAQRSGRTVNVCEGCLESYTWLEGDDVYLHCDDCGQCEDCCETFDADDLNGEDCCAACAEARAEAEDEADEDEAQAAAPAAPASDWLLRRLRQIDEAAGADPSQVDLFACLCPDCCRAGAAVRQARDEAEAEAQRQADADAACLACALYPAACTPDACPLRAEAGRLPLCPCEGSGCDACDATRQRAD